MAEKRKEFDLTNLLNAKSKGAAVQPEEPTRTGENVFDVVMLDVEDLMPSRDNFYSIENIDELAAAVELSGRIEQNLIVKPEVHGKYEVIAGHRRRLAALKLVKEGKEEYRMVPCHIRKESDEIRDRLSLIFTNATARQLTDWEKVRQAEELKEVLTEYKKALQEENRDRPKEERERMGRIREIVAQILNTSTTQVGRMEAISNNLSQDFKAELEKGNINISTAHELSRLDGEGQKKAYEQYGEKGELHIKDVKPEEKEGVTDGQAEKVQEAIRDAVKGEANRAVFEAKDNVAAVERVLRKHFSKSFQRKKLADGRYIYLFQADGITIIDNTKWENFLIGYADIAEMVVLMIENGQLFYDDAMEEAQEEEGGGGTDRAEDNLQEAESELQEKGLDFVEWIQKKYGTSQYLLIKRMIREVSASELEASRDKPMCPEEWERWEDKITNAVSVWVMGKAKEYQRYLQG